MGTVTRSRNPVVVLTAHGEVHTHEEAQEFVHDLNQFVTVQLLEETLVVLSLGKLCKHHGNSYGWVSGQEPRLPWKTDNIVPLVVPGLSVNSGSSLSSTTLLQESMGPDVHLETVLHEAHLQISVLEHKETLIYAILVTGFHRIWRPQKCMHPHTSLRTQIRNILRKWQDVLVQSCPARKSLVI